MLGIVVSVFQQLSIHSNKLPRPEPVNLDSLVLSGLSSFTIITAQGSKNS